MAAVLHVELVDGKSYDVEPTPGDMVRFERHFHKSISTMDTNSSMEELCFLIWAATKRLKETDLEFDDFLDTISTFVPKAQA